MRFPKALSGVKKLFVAAIISIIVAILGTIAFVMVVAARNDAVMLAGGGLGLAASIAVIVALIIQLVGLFQGGKDDIQFKYAFFLTLGAFALSIVSAVFTAVSNEVLYEVSRYLNIGVDILTVLALEYTIYAIVNLAEQLGDDRMAKLGKTLALCVLALFVIGLLSDIYTRIMKTNVEEWVKTTLTVAAVISGVADVAVNIVVIVYYGKAIKMLKQ